jgi:hypothetical protein
VRGPGVCVCAADGAEGLLFSLHVRPVPQIAAAAAAAVAAVRVHVDQWLQACGSSGVCMQRKDGQEGCKQLAGRTLRR